MTSLRGRLFMVLCYTALQVFSVISYSRKIGFKGWEMFVPFYNLACLVEKVTGNWKKVFWLLIALIPLLGTIPAVIIFLVWYIKFCKIIAKAYNAKTILILFFGAIYLPILTMKDAPNCEDPLNRFVTRLFTLNREADQSIDLPDM